MISPFFVDPSSVISSYARIKFLHRDAERIQFFNHLLFPLEKKISITMEQFHVFDRVVSLFYQSADQEILLSKALFFLVQ